MQAWDVIQLTGSAAIREYAGTYTMKIEEDEVEGGFWFTCWDGAMPPHITEHFDTYLQFREAHPVEASADDWEQE